jgi:hypothetical protein
MTEPRVKYYRQLKQSGTFRRGNCHDNIIKTFAESEGFYVYRI